MNIVNRASRTTEDLFSPFEYKINPDTVTHATCIALTNLGGDDTRAVYEVYANNKPRFFALSMLEYPEEETQELEYIRKWTEASSIKFIGKHETEYLDYYLFELESPFGISFR
jgi:hypothetical protein